MEEECKHHQKMCGGSTQGYDRDPHAHYPRAEEEEADLFSQGSLERRVPSELGDAEEGEEAEPQSRKSPDFWPLNPYAPNRTLPGAGGFGLGEQSPLPPEEYAPSPVFGEELVHAMNRQNQSGRTHCHSLQAGGRAGVRPMSLCGPSSPLPGRHMSLRPAPAVDVGLGSGGDLSRHSPTEHYHPLSPSSSSPPRPLHMYQPRSSSFSRGADRLCSHGPPLDSLALALGSGMELRRDGGGGGTAGSRGSSSSQASSGNLSDGGNKPGPDPPCPLKSGGSFKAKPDLKPRPFMGVMDKAVRVQQALGPTRQGPGGAESFSMSLMEFQGQNEFKRASFQDQQSRDTRGSSSSQLLFPEGRHRQASLTRDNPPLHMAPIKPKRSFIESNV